MTAELVLNLRQTCIAAMAGGMQIRKILKEYHNIESKGYNFGSPVELKEEKVKINEWFLKHYNRENLTMADLKIDITEVFQMHLKILNTYLEVEE